MKKTLLLSFCLAFVSILMAQEKDYSLAKVAQKIDNVYIFINCIPVNEYNTIDTWEVYWHKGDPKEAFKEAITRVRKKYNNVDAIIFKDEKFQVAEFIKFIGKETTGGGFKGGDKIVYKDGKILKYGEVSILDNTKQRATIKYLDEYGEEKIDNVPYERLSILAENEYQKVLDKQNTEIQLHKFSNGEKISWLNEGKLSYGEVLGLNNSKHEAKVNYFDRFGDVKTENVNYLKLEKADDDKYKVFMAQQQMEIEKHKFVTGETISFIDDKTYRVGEVSALNNSNHKASIKYLNIYGELKISDFFYFDVEKISAEKFKEENEKYQKEIAKYKFVIGEKVDWSKPALLKKPEIIRCEIISLDDLNHKALIKYLDKENKEKQEKADYLDLSKIN